MNDQTIPLKTRANEVAACLSELANANRLQILCQLAEGECRVSTLQSAVDLSQSALSQHLARLRDAGLVATRREGQTIFYRIADARLHRIMETLHDVFCAAD